MSNTERNNFRLIEMDNKMDMNSYQKPEILVIELCTDGILCQSRASANAEAWDSESLFWDE